MNVESTATETEPREYWIDRVSLWLIAGVLTLILLLAVRGVYSAVARKAKAVKARSLVIEITGAARSFQTEYDKWPAAPLVFEELQVANPRGIIFCDPPPALILSSKIVVDPWGQPLIHDGISGGVPHAHSIGSNGIDEHGVAGTDDISD